MFCKERLGLDAPLGSIDRTKLNVNGSSLAAGHPFAATGGRIVANLAKLLHEKGSGPRPDLDLRRRRPGRRRDPRGLTSYVVRTPLALLGGWRSLVCQALTRAALVGTMGPTMREPAHDGTQ